MDLWELVQLQGLSQSHTGSNAPHGGSYIFKYVYGDEEVNDAYLDKIYKMDYNIKGINIGREQSERIIRFNVSKGKLTKFKHLEQFTILCENTGLRDDMFEKSTKIKKLDLGTPRDAPFKEYPKHISSLNLNVLVAKGESPESLGQGFVDLMNDLINKQHTMVIFNDKQYMAPITTDNCLESVPNGPK